MPLKSALAKKLRCEVMAATVMLRSTSGDGDALSPLKAAPGKPSVDPETAAKIAANREAARQKLAAKGVAVDKSSSSSSSSGEAGARAAIPALPASWDATVGAERQKAYFKGLDAFLAGGPAPNFSFTGDEASLAKRLSKVLPRLGCVGVCRGV